ncbi:Hypothetical protein NTJ_15633 [Nesidiocoris tenuis]|uniref:Uncharacterized protein n=1 Tax=Nesidiocoris tenuis TaxID=355587 RepID=A0ABN7BG12_9HEMI|nr:Hypothetical protein NTJ_15633 [Nesidiocoris tenuis]
MMAESHGGTTLQKPMLWSGAIHLAILRWKSLEDFGGGLKKFPRCLKMLQRQSGKMFDGSAKTTVLRCRQEDPSSPRASMDRTVPS